MLFRTTKPFQEIQIGSIRYQEDINQAIESYLEDYQEVFPYGGYLEKRDIYKSSSHFDGRTIHLGVDFWGQAGTTIYSPWEGHIHALKYNEGAFDYGATMICTYHINGEKIHMLLGHISIQDLKNFKEGEAIAKGQAIAHIGSPEEGGGWVPHLHLQMIKDMEGYTGDYPGVCHPSKLAHYRENCPDPLTFIDL